MKAIVDAIATAANFATLVRDETVNEYQRFCAERTLAKLGMAVDLLSKLQEEKEK